MTPRKMVTAGVVAMVLSTVSISFSAASPRFAWWVANATAYVFVALGIVGALAGLLLAVIGLVNATESGGWGCSGCQKRDEELERLRDALSR